jgi:hypothetical protein
MAVSRSTVLAAASIRIRHLLDEAHPASNILLESGDNILLENGTDAFQME